MFVHHLTNDIQNQQPSAWFSPALRCISSSWEERQTSGSSPLAISKGENVETGPNKKKTFVNLKIQRKIHHVIYTSMQGDYFV